MTILKFSVADHFVDGQGLFDMIAKAGTNGEIEPEVQAISWQIMWPYLQRSRVDQNGFHVSEIGSTWVSGYSDMDLLEELSPDEIDTWGGPRQFIPAAWESITPRDDERIFAIPFLADTRVVYYWRDILADAGIAEENAFSSPAKMEETISRLAVRGKPTWATPTFGVTNIVHQIASWIWAHGGSFFNEDHTQTAFAKDGALEGIIEYFALQKHMTRKYDSLDSAQEAFRKRAASVLMSGPWFYENLMKRNTPAEMMANLGVALPPGPPFVGGSSLVIWKGEEVEPALRWIKQLTTNEKTQEQVTRDTGLLPVLNTLLSSARYTYDHHYAVFSKALKSGRPLPQAPFWGALEAELVRVFGNIWSDLKEDPRYTPKRAVLEHLLPMANMFDGKLYRHSFPPVAPLNQ